MAVKRVALVETATGKVVNVQMHDDSAIWTRPDGITLVDAVYPAEPGGSWDGSSFTAAPAYVPSRMEILVLQVKESQKYDETLNGGDGGLRDKTADEIAAEKAELLPLLKAHLTSGKDLNNDQTQTLLRLQNE